MNSLAHSGFPLMYNWDLAYLLKVTKLEQLGGIWGELHEIGHNMQEDAWTLKGQTQVRIHCSFISSK